MNNLFEDIFYASVVTAGTVIAIFGAKQLYFWPSVFIFIIYFAFYRFLRQVEKRYNSSKDSNGSIDEMKNLKKEMMETLDELETELSTLQDEIKKKEDEQHDLILEIADLANDSEQIEIEIKRVEESIEIISGKKRLK